MKIQKLNDGSFFVTEYTSEFESTFLAKEGKKITLKSGVTGYRVALGRDTIEDAAWNLETPHIDIHSMKATEIEEMLKYRVDRTFILSAQKSLRLIESGQTAFTAFPVREFAELLATGTNRAIVQFAEQHR